jgi:hypothetical protein
MRALSHLRPLTPSRRRCPSIGSSYIHCIMERLIAFRSPSKGGLRSGFCATDLFHRKRGCVKIARVRSTPLSLHGEGECDRVKHGSIAEFARACMR